ncbi:BamA/TamA family outer membrane protein [Flavobacterium sp.]|uniref:BamA/TamA family outer membrane protein n=1 Tax=Flavobacterium sp. TaxID=239 RepID=UPI003790F773
MTTILKSKYFICISSTLLLVLFLQLNVFAQTTQYQKIKSLPDIFKKKDSLLVINPIQNNFFLVIPIIGSQPATGFVYGAVGQYTFKGINIGDKYSTINLGIIYTGKNQLIVNFKNNVMLRDNKIFLSGDWRFYIFSQDNYGLGSDIVPVFGNNKPFDINTLKEPMEYNYLKFHQTISWKIKGNFYIGTGIHLDDYSSIQDYNLNVTKGIFTEHYIYNQKKGFSDTAYNVNGVSLNMVFDSRDNQINTNHGWFANVNYRMNPALNKNQAASTVLYTEFRYFIPLSKTNNQHVFSIWTYGQFITSGKVPYLNLPAIGWDQRSRSGKGYTQGLFRGYNLTYLETEYRFPISRNQLISGTLFTNFTSTSDKDRDIRLFQYIQPAMGIGLRILIDKATRTNLVLNYALGNKSKAFYLNAGETF